MAGALLTEAGRTVLPPLMRLAWASEGTVSDAIAKAITEAVARYEVFTEKFQSWLSYRWHIAQVDTRTQHAQILRAAVDVNGDRG